MPSLLDDYPLPGWSAALAVFLASLLLLALLASG